MNKHDDTYFQYVATVALNHKEIGKVHKEYQKLSLLKTNITETE